MRSLLIDGRSGPFDFLAMVARSLLAQVITQCMFMISNAVVQSFGYQATKKTLMRSVLEIPNRLIFYTLDPMTLH